MSKGMSILLTVLGVILFLMSLLLLIVSPYALIGIAFAVLIVVYAARNMKKLKEEAAAPAPSFRASFAPAASARKPAAAADLDKISTRPFDAVGMRFRMDSVRQILERNPEYRHPDDTTRKYYLYSPLIRSCVLEPEDNNQYDHNAVMILVDGVHVGYIAAGQALRARDALSVGCTFEINLYGGTYKEYDEESSDWIVHRGDLSGKVSVHKPISKES